MPIRMNKPSESSFGINIEDAFDSTDDHVIKLVDMEEYNGISKQDGKPYTSITWKFTIHDENGVAYSNLIDGGVFESWQFSSLSLGEKSTGRAWAAALLGKASLTDAECDALAERFDDALIGKSALASWKIEDDGKGNKRLKIALLRPLRKGRGTGAPAADAAPPTNGEARQARMTEPAPEFIPREVATGPVAYQPRESAADRRARLEQELAAMDEDAADDHDVPF